MSRSPARTASPRPIYSQDMMEAGSSLASPKEEDKKPDDSCPVCLAPKMHTRTSLDCCNHEFCHMCLKQWLMQAGNCPVCRQVPIKFYSNRGKSNEKRYTLADVKKEKEEMERDMIGNTFPLTSEKEILMKRKHELNRIINSLQPTEVRPRWKREGHSKTKDSFLRSNRDYEEAVTERNGIQLLLDGIEDGSLNRQSLVSHLNFRSLIYLYDCEWYLVDPTLNVHMRRFTRQLARENQEAQRLRLTQFVARELTVVPLVPLVKNNMKGPCYRQKCADKIIEQCQNHQIHSPGFSRYLLCSEVGMVRHAVERFQHELFEFASSQLSLVEFCKISGYRLPDDVRRSSPNDNNFAVGGLNDLGEPDVITLNDTNDTGMEEDVIISDDEPVVLASTQGERNNGRSESNYLRDEPASSGSERDEVFHRPACRLRQQIPIGRNWQGPHLLNTRAFQPVTDIFNGNRFLTQFGFPNPMVAAPRYQQVFGDRPSTSGLRNRNDSDDVHIIDVGSSRSRTYSRSTPGTPYSARSFGRSRSPAYSRRSSEREVSNSRSLGSVYGTPGGSGENSNSSQETRPSSRERRHRSEKRSRRNSNERERSRSHSDRIGHYRRKLERYHRSLTSTDRQNSINWLRRELETLEESDRNRNGRDRGEDRGYHNDHGQYSRSRSVRYNGNR